MTQLSTPSHSGESDLLSRPLLTSIALDWEKALYAVFILLAILTRFWDLGSRVMSHDESLHTQFSYQFYNGDGFSHTPLMHGPFLFHITAVAYWLFGDNDLSARIPVAIFGVILVAMPYLFRRWLGRIGALFASFIFLISPYITYYSRYIRHDIYVITWALIVFAAIWYYLKHPHEKYLWWFAAGTALMFSTKEVAFIYVAIFGSFLLLRLASQIVASDWIVTSLPALRRPMVVALIGALVLGGGYLAKRSAVAPELATEATESTEGFAADPNEVLATEGAEAEEAGGGLVRWAQIAGVAILGIGVFLALQEVREQLDAYPEFDLIMLFTTLVLPTVTPLFIAMGGWNPLDSTLSKCVLEGQETMSSLQLWASRLGNTTCWSAFFSSGVVRSGAFLVVVLVIAVLLGLWWNRRRWLIAAAIFHAIFFLLYTSVFTNPAGWSSGMIRSLGYWLEQQGVERGSQPWFYYLFVTPFYEFLAVAFALAAVRLWLRTKGLLKAAGYWLTLILGVVLFFTLSDWLFNRTAVQGGLEQSSTPSLFLSGLIFGIGTLYWFFIQSRQRRGEMASTASGPVALNVADLFGFVPFLIWWLVLTVFAYSYAGEKMPWLSTHFVIPMALLTGWYFSEKLRGSDPRALLSSPALGLFGLTVVLLVAAMLALGPLLLGTISLGDQELENLKAIGRFLGNLAVAGAVTYFWRRYYVRNEPAVRQNVIILGIFALLSLLTIRFTYMASFPNADSSREFMVYAHGAPATKQIVMKQVEELSMRLHGDKSIRVAFSRDTSWPFTWYLREYPNRVFYGDNPSQSLKESPIIITGSLDWAKTEPYLGNDYEQATYTYLWWPMEEYRKISWPAILGDPNALERRGLGNPDVRQALWDIFFYRDYEKYGQVFGGTYTPGQWPLRHEMRLYIRRDVLATLWDQGISVASAKSFEDPYAEKALQLAPVMVINESGIGGAADGQLLAPRNVAVGGDGRIYVVDSGNHRVQVFDGAGSFLYGWGSAGIGAGQFNEPWGIAVTEDHVFVADTWNHRIQKFTQDGSFVNSFGQSGSPVGEESGLGLFFGPRDIAVLDNGQLLVTDTGNHRMQILDQDGNFIRQVGEFGNLLGQVNEPVGLAVSPDGSIFLADTWNARIQRFSPDLFPLNDWQVSAWKGQSTNNKPYLDTDSAGRVFVSDPEGYRVLIFSSLGEYLGRFGEFGVDVRSLGLPNGIAIDGEDNLLVADAGNNRVLKFAPVFTRAGVQPADEPAGILGGEAPFSGQPILDEASDDLELEPSPSGQEESGGEEGAPAATP